LGQGVYNFTYTVMGVGTCADDMVTVQVTINEQPNTGTATPFIVCETDLAANSPLDLFGQLTGEDAGGTFIDNDATGALSGSMVDLTVLTVGNYTFTYTITSGDGCSNETIIPITVEEAPEAGTATDFEICEENVASMPTLDLFGQLTGNDAGGTWNDDDATGALNGSIVDLTALGQGVYNFTYTVMGVGTCADDMVTVQVTINEQPNTGTATPFIVCETDLAANSPLDLFGQLTGEDAGGTFIDNDTTGALSGSMVDLTVLTVGNYTFTYTITSGDGCSNETIIPITVEEAPEAGIASPFEICIVDIPSMATLDLFNQLTVNDAGGIWNDDDATGALTGSIVDLTALGQGVYNFTYTVMGIGTCADDMATVQVSVNDISAPAAPSPQEFCDSATVSELIATGTTIQWYDSIDATTPLNDSTALVDGTTYYATQTDATTGCESSVRAEVQVIIYTSPQSGTPTTPGLMVCSTDTMVDLFGGLTTNTFDTNGNWMDTSNTGALNGNIFDASQVGPGTYQFTYTVAGTPPCTDASTTISVTVEDAVFAGNDTTLEICSDSASIDLLTLLPGADTGGSFSPALASGTTIFDPLQDADGTYTYTVMNGCNTDMSNLVITVTQAPDAGQNGSITICRADGTIDLLTVLGGTPDANGTFTPSLSSGTSIFDPEIDTAGMYTYTVQAQAPCTTNATAQVTIFVNDSPAPVLVNSTASFCATEMPSIADLDPFIVGTNVQWFAEIDSTTPLLDTDLLIDGKTYYATQTEGSGCESNTRVALLVIVNSVETPIIDRAAIELCVIDNPTLQTLTVLVDQYDPNTMNVVWYDSATNDIVLPLSTLLENGATYYAALIDDTTLCESEVRLEITVDLTNCDTILLPDGFSPNGDGTNDEFIVKNLDVVYPKYELEIYNRNGNMVYKGNAGTDPFDGTSNQSGTLGSNVLPVGVYFFIINYNDDKGTAPRQGRLYLSR